MPASFETSLMLAVKPETVHMERAVQEYPVRPTTYGMDNTSIGELSVSGTYGNPVPVTEGKRRDDARTVYRKIYLLL